MSPVGTACSRLLPVQHGRMILRMRLASVVVVLAIAVSAHARSSDAAARGEALIQQAQDKINIFALHSFRMNANVRIDNFGKPLDGTYSLLWNGPDQWREEITFPGYSEVEVGSRGNVYVQRNTPILPYRIFQVHETLGFGATGIGTAFFNAGPNGNEVIKGLHDKKIDGAKVTCVEITTEMKYTRNVCIDQATGTIKRDKENLVEKFVDSDLQPVGPKLFPHSLSLLERGKQVTQVHITTLESPASFNTADFQPPAGAFARTGCMNPVPARKIKDVMPRYPEEDKYQKNQGTVGVYAIIDSAGIPQNLKITLSASPTMNTSSLESLRQWRYRPATCSGYAVETETVVEIHNTLE